MSPSAALSSEIVRIYLGLIVSFLAAAGALIAFLRWGLHRDVDHAWKAYCGWLIMVPPAFVCLFLGREVMIVFFTAVAVFAFKEFARGTGLYEDWSVTGTVYLGIIAVGVVSLVYDPGTGNPGWFGMFAAMPVYVIAVLLVIPILRNRAEGQIQVISLAALGFIYIGWMFGHLIFLANSTYAYGYLLYILFAVEVNDVAAYTFGKLFGRHPLRSNISPQKTWEGAVGALAVSLALPWLLRFSFPHFGTLELVLTGLIVGVAGQLGDLSISVVKRDLGIREMGALILGHGGILDRIDSLIYVVPLYFHMVRYFHDLY